MPPTTSPVELAWIVGTLACIGSVGRNLYDAQRDLAAVQGQGPVAVAARVLGRGEVERHTILLVVQIGFLGIGLVAALTPEPLTAAVDVLNLITAAVLIVGQIALTVKSARERYWRRRAHEAFMKAQREQGER